MDCSGDAAGFLPDRYLSEHRVDGSPFANDEFSAPSSRIAADHARDWLRYGIADASFSENGLVASPVEEDAVRFAQTRDSTTLCLVVYQPQRSLKRSG